MWWSQSLWTMVWIQLNVSLCLNASGAPRSRNSGRFWAAWERDRQGIHILWVEMLLPIKTLSWMQADIL